MLQQEIKEKTTRKSRITKEQGEQMKFTTRWSLIFKALCAILGGVAVGFICYWLTSSYGVLGFSIFSSILYAGIVLFILVLTE